jgi:hypothetical protein
MFMPDNAQAKKVFDIMVKGIYHVYVQCIDHELLFGRNLIRLSCGIVQCASINAFLLSIDRCFEGSSCDLILSLTII